MILKVQRPIRTVGGNGNGCEEDEAGGEELLLVYGEDREDIRFLHLPEPVARELMGERVKVYVEAEEVGGRLEIRGLVPDQDW